MNTKQKKCQLLMQILFFVFSLVCLPNSFASNSNDNFALKETVIKITDTQVNLPVMIFKTPGEQRITIENHLSKDVDIRNAYFVGNEYTAHNIANNIHIKSIDGCSTIKAKTSCSLVVNVEKNVSPSANPNGEQLLWHYTFHGEQDNKFAQLNIKLDCNNDVIFKVRNLGFTGELETWMDTIKYVTKKLTIINNNPSYSIDIKKIELAERKDRFKYVVKDHDKHLLKSNDSCEVEIAIRLDADNGAVPIYVTYDVVDENNVVVKKDLIATAVAVVKYRNKETESQHVLQPVKAAIYGVISGATIIAPFNDCTQNWFIAVLPTNIANIATDVITGPLAGLSYFAGDKLFEQISGKYDSDYGVNKVIVTTVMYTTVGLVFCLSSPVGYAYCVAGSAGAGLGGSLFGQSLTEMVYPDVEHPLSEQSWYGWFKDKTKLPFNYAVSAFFRKVSKINLGISKDGLLTEISQDASSAAVMDLSAAVVDLFKQHPELLVAKNATSTGTPIYDSYKGCKECTCANLPPEPEDNRQEHEEL